MWTVFAIATILLPIISMSTGKPIFSQPVDPPLTHPRLFFAGETSDELRQKANSTHADIWQPIQEYAFNNLANSLPAEAPANGDLEIYRDYGNAIIPIALTCVITDEADYCDLAKHYLLTFAGWQQWGENNWRDLGHAHMLMGNSLAYDWLYSRLTPAEREEVRISLGNWAEKLYEASSSDVYVDEWQNWWRKAYVQNHHAIVNSALGMAGLALLGEDERADKWVAHAAEQLSRFQYLLNGIEDGSWHESIPYQSYALTMSLPFLVNLRSIQNQNLLPDVYLRNYPYWGIYNLLPNSIRFLMTYGNFEWSWGNAFQPQNIYRFIAAEYGDHHAEWLARQLIDANGRNANIWSAPYYAFEFFYYDPSIAAAPPTNLPLFRVFPDLEGVIWRTGWDNDDLLFGLKSGPYGGRFAFETFVQNSFPWEPPCADSGCMFNIDHNHDDSNTFYMFRAGSWLAPENIGVSKTETSYHNTILIDGQGQYRPKEFWEDPEDFRNSDAFLVETANTPTFNYVASDATRRYKQIPGIQEVTRYVLFVRKSYFLMVDNLLADSPHRFEWISHFGNAVSVQDKWILGAAGDGQILGVYVVAPESFVTETGNDGLPYVRIRPETDANNARFVNLLFPTREAEWHLRPAVHSFSDSGGALLMQVDNINESMSLEPSSTDTVLLTYTQPHNSLVAPQTIGSYSFDGRAAVISQLPDGTLTHLMIHEGTFLSDDSKGILLIDNLDAAADLEITYSQKSVILNGNLPGDEIKLYAPNASELLINGKPTAFQRIGDYIVQQPQALFLPQITQGAKLLSEPD